MRCTASTTPASCISAPRGTSTRALQTSEVHAGCLLLMIVAAVLNREWEAKMNQVKVSKEDMNRLIMNFLVTEVF